MSDFIFDTRFSNEQQAFKQLYEQRFMQLYRFALAMVKDRETAQDIVNDVFLKLWNRRHEPAAIENLNVYLYVSVKNAALNFLKRTFRRHYTIDNLDIDHLHISVDPEVLLITTELKNNIEKAINTLPTRCRLVFKLIREDGLTYKEVAAILQVSPKTVDTQLSIALKKLERILSPLLTKPAKTVSSQ